MELTGHEDAEPTMQRIERELRFPGANLIFFVLITGLIIPYESLIIPLYQTFKDWRMLDSLPALILPQIGVSVTLGTFWMRGFFRSTPRSITEAARVDGAGPWRNFWEVTFPLMLPVSITAILIRIIFKLKLADVIINVTSGGPGGATDSVTSFIFREYRDRSNVGYGTLLAIVYLIQGAPDLAITQFLVETLTIVVFLLVLARLPSDFSPAPAWAPPTV